MKHAVAVVLVALLCSPSLAFAQVGQKPAGRKPAPSTRKPATAKPAPAKPAPAVKPEPPPPSDIRFKSKYTTGDQITESTTYVRGNRERYELGDMILLRQHDLKQTVQISQASNTYLIVPVVPAVAVDPAAPAAETQKSSGVVNVETSVAEVGERKPLFGQQARRVVTVIDRQPQAGACDQSKQQMETDGWYIDAPKALAAQAPAAQQTSAAACRDEIKPTLVGDAALLGFPMAYTTTIPGADGKPVIVMQMEITEYEVTNLDASLFDIPAGMTAAANAHELVKAVSDANEAKLAARTPSSGAPPAKKAGVIRIGVPELANKTTQNVDTRALRTQLIAELAEQKMEGVPLAAAAQDELHAYAKELGCNYLLISNITELKASKPGRVGRMIKATAGEATNKDVTEAKLTLQLVPVGGAKPRFSTNTSGNDGGIGFKTGLRLARAAAMLYLRYASPLGALNVMSMMNMGGMGGFLSNPMLMQMQGGGALGTGRGLDRTAGAAMFMMDQAMAGASSDGTQDGPSFDASLAEALQDGAKKVGDNLKR